MAIKNFLVKTKQVKQKGAGLERQLRYIHDDKAPSHKHTEITPLLHGKKLLGAYDERRLDRQMKGLRGGGVVNRATRFIISVPNTIAHPTTKQWQEILRECVREVAKVNDIPLMKLADHCEAVIHDESRSGKHSHIHLVVSNIIDKQYVKGITQKKTTYGIKTAFNRAVKSVLKVGPRQYLPEKTKTVKSPYSDDLENSSKPSPNRRSRKKRRFKK